jgi:uncharacterized protein YjbJ (UPF0337 family)
MSDIENRTEQAKGRTKQAVGDLTDNDDLKREGALDKASGEAKEKAEGVKDKVEDVIDSVKDKLSRD